MNEMQCIARAQAARLLGKVASRTAKPGRIPGSVIYAAGEFVSVLVGGKVNPMAMGGIADAEYTVRIPDIDAMPAYYVADSFVKWLAEPHAHEARTYGSPRDHYWYAGFGEAGYRDERRYRQRLVFEAEPFRKALNVTFHAMATTDIRYYLVGLHLGTYATGPAETTCHMVTTDGHRLADAYLGALKGSDAHADTSMIIPRPTVEFLRRVLGRKSMKGADTITVTQYDTEAVVDLPTGARLTTRLIDGRYPDWQSVVPNPHAAERAQITLERPAELAQAVRDAQALVSEEDVKHAETYLRFNGTQTRVWPMVARDIDENIASVTMALPSTLGTKCITAGFTTRYLVEACEALAERQAVLSISTREQHMSDIMLFDAPDYRFAIMPVRL